MLQPCSQQPASQQPVPVWYNMYVVAVPQPMQVNLYPAGMCPVAIYSPTHSLSTPPTQSRSTSEYSCTSSDAPMQPEALSAPVVKSDTQNCPLAGKVLRMSMDEEGSLVVQDALEAALSDHQRVALASEFRTRVWTAVQNPHANHVIQKCINMMPPTESQFIIDEIQNGGEKHVLRAARHQFGCRILQRLLEHCSSDQMQQVLEYLLVNAMSLTMHKYGNYVLQALAEHGTPEQVSRLAVILAENVGYVKGYGYGVLETVLRFARGDDQSSLANAILDSIIASPELLESMATSHHGSVAAREALRIAGSPQKEAAVKALVVEQDDRLASSRYGRALRRSLEPK